MPLAEKLTEPRVTLRLSLPMDSNSHVNVPRLAEGELFSIRDGVEMGEAEAPPTFRNAHWSPLVSLIT